MKAATFCVVGKTESGKSTWVKNTLKGVPLKNQFIFDFQNEYDNSSGIKEFDSFVSHATRRKNSVIVFEEATVYITGNTIQKGVKNLLVSKSSHHNNNVLIFVFHAVRKIPVNLFEMTDYIVLFETNDRADEIRKFRNPILTARMLQLKNEPKKGPIIIRL